MTKKFNTLSLLKALLVLFSLSFMLPAKAQCSASFSHTVNANGYVTFLASVPSTSYSQTFFWQFTGGSPATQSVNSSVVSTVSTTYSANGIYTASLFYTSFACSTSVSQTILVNTLGGCQLAADFSYSVGSNQVVGFNNMSTGTLTGTTYNWNFGDGSSSTFSAPSHTYSVGGADTATVTLTAYNNSIQGCMAINTKTFSLVTGFVGMKNLARETLNYRIYPNPADGAFNLKLNVVGIAEASVDIYNVSGEKVHSASYKVNDGIREEQIDLRSMPDGIYFIKLYSFKKAAIQKLIINH
jgi:hypothetical protein